MVRSNRDQAMVGVWQTYFIELIFKYNDKWTRYPAQVFCSFIGIIISFPVSFSATNFDNEDITEC